MSAPLIGILGRKRSGKDTLAAALVERHGFVRTAFADPLKRVTMDLDPAIRIEADEAGPLRPEIDFFPWAGTVRLSQILSAVGWERAKGIREVRRLLQAHGEAIRTHVGRHVWVDATMARVRGLRHDDPWGPPGTPVVVTDVRYENEADAIHDAGGLLVRVHRPSLASADDHISETELDDYIGDVTITNDGTVTDLQEQAAGILALI